MPATSTDPWLRCLLRAQVLWHAATLACCGLSGVLADQSLTPLTVSTMQGLMVSLTCELTATNVSVVLVVWNKCGKPNIAIYSGTEAKVMGPFKDRFILAEGYGIAIRSAEYNDTGDYCCLFQTFPDGRYDGRIFLEVKAPSTLTNTQLALAICLPLGVLLAVVLVTARIYIFKPRRRLQCRATPCSSNNYANSVEAANTLPRMAVEATVSRSEVVQGTVDSNETHNYFNVLQYRCVDNCKMAATACKNPVYTLGGQGNAMM